MSPSFLILLAASVTVIDGDTLIIDGERVRLHGIDAPEIRRAQCPEEREKGLQARAFVQGVLSTNAAIELNAVQVKPDRYGRTIGTVSIAGEDLGEMLIDAGYAAEWDYDGGAEKPEWCR